MPTLFEIIVDEVLSHRNSNRPYKMYHPDELFGYTRLMPKETGLNYAIFVDDEKSYKRDNHQPLLFVKNGNNNIPTDFIPISISSNPSILDHDIVLNISTEDIKMVQSFIKSNLELLLRFANEKISHVDFFDGIKPFKRTLNEMSKLSKEITNLPMDIWVDETATFMGHAPRLKFKASKEQRLSTEYSTMLLCDPPTIENFPKKSNLNNKDIAKLKEFVILNLDALRKLAKNEISLRDFFEVAHFPKQTKK